EMANNIAALSANMKERLPDNTRTFIHQTDDGIIFYGTRRSPPRLFVKWQGKEIDAKMPGPNDEFLGAHGDAIYFTHEQKIYKAIFTPSQGIVVSYVREIQSDELVYWGGFCTRIRDEKKIYIYRMCEDPYGDGVLINISDILSMELKRFHRGRAIFISREPNVTPSVLKVKKNVVVIKLSDCIIHAQESNRYIYFASESSLNALDTEQMTFLPPLQINEKKETTIICDIVGVHIGVITLRVNSYLMTAQLPFGYFEQPISSTHVVEDRVKEMSIDTSITVDSFDELSDQCCCSICSEVFGEDHVEWNIFQMFEIMRQMHSDSVEFVPRFLDCGHTFCEKCIYNDRVLINNLIKCPNCSNATILTNRRQLAKNFAILSMAEQLMKTRSDPKVVCRSCEIKFSPSSVRMCIKEDCVTFNQLICLSCVVDGGHGGHVVKYDVKLEKIRNELREEITEICSRVEEKKQNVLDITDTLVQMTKRLKMNISHSGIPPQVIGQLDSLASEQDVNEYREIVVDLAKTIIDKCDTIAGAFNTAMETATVCG
ncbi:hypothetical protein PENTCL1PPCAC_8792, partial [Pristionchus entomophagus]